MNQIKARRETIELMDRELTRIAEDGRTPEKTIIANLPPELQPAQLRDMMERVDKSAGSDSAAKTGRWLGWMQAAVVAMQLATFDDMKEINKRNRDE